LLAWQASYSLDTHCKGVVLVIDHLHLCKKPLREISLLSVYGSVKPFDVCTN
jgi:hypothetical protein